MFLKVINEHKKQVELLNCSYVKDDKDRLVFCGGDRNISILKNKNIREDYIKVIENCFLENETLIIENLKDFIKIKTQKEKIHEEIYRDPADYCLCG